MFPLQPPPPRDEFLSSEFWEENTPRFVPFAERQIQWRIRHGVPKAALEYVNQAALLLLSDRRHCPDYISPVRCVFWIIDKLIRNDAVLLQHRSVHVPITTVPNDDGSANIDESLIVDKSEFAATEEIEAREILEEFVRNIPRKFHRYVAARLRGCATASERAAALGISTREVLNLDKTMRRLRPRWSGKTPPKTRSRHSNERRL